MSQKFVTETSRHYAMLCRIMNEPADENVPSFEKQTYGATQRETYGRVHQAHLPKEERPGPMKVYGRNPAEKWLDDLSDADPVMREQLYHHLKDLRGSAYIAAVQQAYIKHAYFNDRPLPEQPYDFSQIFKE